MNEFQMVSTEELNQIEGGDGLIQAGEQVINGVLGAVLKTIANAIDGVVAIKENVRSC